MSNEEESLIEEVDNTSVESSEEEEVIEETSVPLSQYEKIKDDYLRLAAEFDNYKKRTEKEKESIGTASVAYFVNSLFPLIDNFEMAMSQEKVSKDLETFNNLLTSVLEGLQVEEIGTVGENFDPSIHEAVELQDVPEFQKYVASTAFVEGWGLYAEQLANEMGLYSNDVQQLGRLGNDAWRACRLVLDTGMHGMGWSRDKAIEFFRANSPIEEINAEIETDRYIAWPGQACSYKMGQLKIEELRSKAENELGNNFDIRLFHDEVLCDGGITLPILENKIDTFIVQHKS